MIQRPTQQDMNVNLFKLYEEVQDYGGPDTDDLFLDIERAIRRAIYAEWRLQDMIPRKMSGYDEYLSEDFE